MAPSPARIEWAPDGSRLLAFFGGVIRLHGLEPSSRPREIAKGYLDARWHPDGRIVAVDTYAHWEHFTPKGVRHGTSDERGNRFAELPAAAISGTGLDVVVIGAEAVTVSSIGANRTWTSRWEQGIHPRPGYLSAALSGDGKLVAIGYETTASDDPSARRASGRGWLVLDLGPRSSGSGSRRGQTVVDRHWYPCVRDEGPIRFAFDRGPYARRRLAITAPERAPGIGVIRIGSDEATKFRKPSDAYPHTHLGGASAVALDDRGILAAYAYPPGVGERRLRVDYLTPQPRGPAVVEILDTLWIDPDLEHITALAFDAAGQRIACLGADGSVEVVPVP